MLQTLTAKLASYVDSHHPILYVPYFDAEVVDGLIAPIAQDYDVHEFNPASGLVDFRTKRVKVAGVSLREALAYVDDVSPRKRFVVLRDVHHYLSDPEVLARLKSIALKNAYDSRFQTTVFINSSELVLPPELQPFVTIVDVPLPSEREIGDHVRAFARHQGITVSDSVVETYAFSLRGLSSYEITRILSLAYLNDGTLTEAKNDIILKEKEQIIRKSDLVELIQVRADLDNDLAGLNRLKTWLRDKSHVFKNLEDAQKAGVDIPKGVLMIGMPGCGKSLAAKATAQLFNVPLLRLDVGKLLGKYVGESETNLRKALRIAEAASPCVLWIDEIEKAFAGIGSSGSGSEVTTRLFGNFLTWMQEKDSAVFTVATANDVEKLPPEFLRKGRFDEMFFVDFPNDLERREILRLHLSKRGHWKSSINLTPLMSLSKNFSGADLESAVKEAVEKAFCRGESVTTESLEAVLKETKSIYVTQKDKIEKLRERLVSLDIQKATDQAIDSLGASRLVPHHAKPRGFRTYFEPDDGSANLGENINWRFYEPQAKSAVMRDLASVMSQVVQALR